MWKPIGVLSSNSLGTREAISQLWWSANGSVLNKAVSALLQRSREWYVQNEVTCFQWKQVTPKYKDTEVSQELTRVSLTAYKLKVTKAKSVSHQSQQSLNCEDWAASWGWQTGQCWLGTFPVLILQLDLHEIRREAQFWQQCAPKSS